jgi:predicted transcriptional regulator
MSKKKDNHLKNLKKKWRSLTLVEKVYISKQIAGNRSFGEFMSMMDNCQESESV